MGAECVELFFKKVAGDKVLQEQLRSAINEKQDEELVAAICALAAEQGQVFSVEEAEQFAESIAVGNGELNDAALEQVNAAGFWDDIKSIIFKMLPSSHRRPAKGYKYGQRPSEPIGDDNRWC